VNYLLDTSAISELVSPRPNMRVLRWIEAIPEERMYLSVITIGELQKGVTKLPASRRSETLRSWLHDDLLMRFRGRLVALDVSILLAWGKLAAELEKRGKPMPALDGLIAASALHSRLTLVTRNVADFAGTGVPIINPWDE
jgi:predicted nucleic acid-binding protein